MTIGQNETGLNKLFLS